MDVANRVKKLIVDHIGCEPDEVTDSAELWDIGADSLDKIEIVQSLEVEFDIAISDDDADRMVTVGDVVEFVESCVKVTA